MGTAQSSTLMSGSTVMLVASEKKKKKTIRREIGLLNKWWNFSSRVNNKRPTFYLCMMSERKWDHIAWFSPSGILVGMVVNDSQ